MEALKTPFRDLYENHGSSPISADGIYSIWKMSSSSYSARSRVAALHAYGLLSPFDMPGTSNYWCVPMHGTKFLRYDRHGSSDSSIVAAGNAALKPAVFREIWNLYRKRLGRCVSEADFRRVGNVIFRHLTTEAEPRYSEKGAGKLVSVFLQNLVYVGLISGVDTLPYAGPFIPTAASEKPVMRLAPDSNGGVVFELRIRERVTRQSIKEVLELITAVSPFIEKRENMDEE